MKKTYIITGANGHLGNTMIRILRKSGAQIRGLILPGEQVSGGANIRYIEGDVRDAASLEALFEGLEDRDVYVIHTAGIIDISEHVSERMYEVNVGGTRNIVRLCLEHRVKRLVYVSSVHAIPEKGKLNVLKEVQHFSPDEVVGGYAKTKAEATQIVLDAVQEGLDAVVVHPSGILGPYDTNGNHLVQMVQDYIRGKLPACVRGGYDFVDVRDVAKGILACAENGEPGKGYILSGHYITIRRMLQIVGKAAKLIYRPICLPLKLARLAAPYCERRCLKEKKPLFFTPYSISVLGSNGRFTHDAATERFAYRPRPIEETLRDMTAWLVSQKAKAGSAL